jgi:hypothetical protein
MDRLPPRSQDGAFRADTPGTDRPMTRTRLGTGPIAALALLLALAPAAARADQLLYDPASGQLPDHADWGWSYLSLPTAASRSVDAVGGFTTLDTTAGNNIQAGYSLTSTPLDRLAGYTIRLDLRIADEAHARDDRAGFSLIALGDDRLGIELGFWDDQVWAQDVGFTRAEAAAFDTTATTRYDLAILGDSYTLFADGSALLSGVLRDYSASGLPYNVPNFLFLGDNTTSARGSAEIGRVEFLATAVPEPASAALLAAGALALRALRGRRRKA